MQIAQLQLQPLRQLLLAELHEEPGHIVVSSGGSPMAAHSKLGSDSSPSANERARGRRTTMRWASGTPLAPDSTIRSDSIGAENTNRPAEVFIGLSASARARPR